jgi:S-DNA-T family DNA segregation ATPase FtsK/SpoIIIE
VSLLQRALGIGYGRAARLIDYMAEDGIVGQYNGSQAREVQITLDQWAAMSGQAEAEPVAPSTPARMGATTTALSVTGLAKPKRNRILPDADEDSDDDLSEPTPGNSLTEHAPVSNDQADLEDSPFGTDDEDDNQDDEGDEPSEDDGEEDESSNGDRNSTHRASTSYRSRRYTA